MPDKNSARSDGMVSDDRVRDVLGQLVRQAISVERRFARAELADLSGVNIHTIDAITSADPAKHRKICLSTGLSLAVVLGPRAVNLMLSLIGYGGANPLDEPDDLNLRGLVATGLQAFSTIATAAADGRIDHLEAPICMEAADTLIATILPLSSAGRAE